MNFLDVINKGVPISIPLDILYSDLYELSSNKFRLQSRTNKQFGKYMNYLKSIVPKNDIDFFSSFCVISDYETLNKNICFSPSGFFSSLVFNLNVDNICYKNSIYSTFFDSDMKAKLQGRIIKLRNLSRTKDLKKEFPMLYKKYTKYEECYKNVLFIQKMFENPDLSTTQQMLLRKKTIESFKEKSPDDSFSDVLKEAQHFSFESFCKSYAESFEKLLEHSDEIVDYLLSHPLDINSLQIDKEKLELYIASVSMLTCMDDNICDKQRFIYYISDYFSENKNRKHLEEPMITIWSENYSDFHRKNKGIEFTPKKLYEQYRCFLKNHPEIKLVHIDRSNFDGMNLDEAEQFLFEYLKDLQANWDILPEDDLNHGIIKSLSDSDALLKDKMSDEEKRKHQERLMDLLVEKKELYGSTNPTFCIKGKDTFDGYIGFIYPNGIVVLDKFYENAKVVRIADGEAIYVMRIEDFYRLSQFPKNVLIKDSRVGRIIHAGAWQNKVLNVINGGSDFLEETNQEIKRLIKTGKIEE